LPLTLTGAGPGFVRPWLQDSVRFRILSLILAAVLASAVAFQPALTVAVAVLAGAFLLVTRNDRVAVPLLIVLMGNTKVNYFTPLVTVFPEYLVLFFLGIAWAYRWADGERFEGNELLGYFALLFAAGCLSFLNAMNPTRVFSKALLIPIAGFVFYVTQRGVRTENELRRALRVLEIAAIVVATYGILQIAGIFFGWDLGLRFLQRWGNPDFEYSVGAPVLQALTRTFRANSFFNDPNIFGGYVAAVIPIVLALRLHAREIHSSRGRSRFELVLLLALGVSLILSISRSGIIGAVFGIATVLVLMPEVLARTRFWAALASAFLAIALLTARIGVNPLLVVTRLVGSAADSDVSGRTHLSVFTYGLSLLGRFPITGVGLRNFGYFYGSEIDANYPNMMSHNAVLSYFAESGLLGGCAFLALLFAIGRRPWRAVRDRSLRRERPYLYAALTGLTGSLVALFVTNLFYDYSLRTFVWVLCGLAVAAARLAGEVRHPTAPS